MKCRKREKVCVCGSYGEAFCLQWSPIQGDSLPISVPNIAGTGLPKDLTEFWSQRHTGQYNWERKKMQPQTKELCVKRACAPEPEGRSAKPWKGPVGAAATGSAEHTKLRTAALILRSPGKGTHPTETDRTQAARAAWRGGKHKASRCAGEVRRSKTGSTVASACQIGTHECSWLGLRVRDKNIWMQSSPLTVLDKGGARLTFNRLTGDFPENVVSCPTRREPTNTDVRR